MAKQYTFYGFITGFEVEHEHALFTSKEAAMREARHQANDLEIEIEVERYRTRPITKASICAILASGGGNWVREQATIATVAPRRKADG